MTAYKRHNQTGTTSCARCRAAAQSGEARYRKQRYLYGPRKISSLSSQRRLRALHAIGWTAAEIGQLMVPPVSDVAVQKTLRTPLMYRDKVAQLERIYDQLWNTPGTSVRTMRRAARAGWPPPMELDDDRLDDPDYVPHVTVMADWSLALEENRERRKRGLPSSDNDARGWNTKIIESDYEEWAA